MRCHFCDHPIDPNSRFTWHRITGWERPGQAGGSDITLRERTGGGVACDPCIRAQKAGVNVRQQALV